MKGRGHLIKVEAGEQFGRLTAIRRVENRSRSQSWLFKCNTCGQEGVTGVVNVKNGYGISCKCYRAAMRINRNRLHALLGEGEAHPSYKHGHARKGKCTPEYYTWIGMLQRCYNTNSKSYEYYGGLGIEVCERWHKFENFLADMGPRPLGTTLDRINPNGNYEPGNCRWADWDVQARNKWSRG